jgi:hypothetical protein
MDNIIPAILGFISAYFVFYQKDKGNQLKFITSERQKWTEKIRELSVEFLTGVYVNNELKQLNNQELRNIRQQVAVRLNPDDLDDKSILKLMDCYIENNCNISRKRIAELLIVSFSSLLKHDWERVKNETKMEGNSSKIILFLASVLIMTFFFSKANDILSKINFFEYRYFLSNNFSFYDLIFWKFIFFILSILLMYHLLKFLRWRRKFRFENNLKWCSLKKKKDSFSNCSFKIVEPCICTSQDKTDNLKIWNKYLGYTIRKNF